MCYKCYSVFKRYVIQSVFQYSINGITVYTRYLSGVTSYLAIIGSYQASIYHQSNIVLVLTIALVSYYQNYFNYYSKGYCEGDVMTAILDYTSYLIIYVVAIPSHLNMLCSIEGYVEFTSCYYSKAYRFSCNIVWQ